MSSRPKPIAAAMNDSFLSVLPRSTVDAVLERSVVHHYPATTAVAGEGDALPIALVVSGLLRLYLERPDGSQLTVRHLRRGDVFNLNSLVGHRPVTAVQALQDSVVVALDDTTLRRTATLVPQFSWVLTREAVDQLEGAYRELAFQLSASVYMRLARELLDRVDDLVVTVSQEELAEALGTAREVVSRTLARMRRRGMIKVRPGRITIVDPKRLRAASGLGGARERSPSG